MTKGFLKLKVFLSILFVFALTYVNAQEDARAFGQNRVQYKNFDWHYYSTDNFDIHYYAEGHEYAKLALKYLTEEFEKITDMIGYPPYAKTKIFIFNSTTDLQQSNVGIDGATFDIAGQTNFIKLQVEIAYPGSVAEFKKELDYKIANLLIQDMMFGGSLVEMFQSAYLLNLPAWFVDGAANYVAYGWSVEMDDFMRDFLSGEKIKKLSKYDRSQAGLIGQSVWNYIALKYGKSNVSNILNLTRIIRNSENSIASSLGIPFKQFKYEWMEYYRNSNRLVANEFINPDTEDLIAGKSNKLESFHHVKISPNGSKVVYSVNYKGKYKVIVRDVASGKERVVLKGGSQTINQVVDKELPLIEWISDEKLGIVQVEYGFHELVIFDLEENTKLKKSLKKFNQVKDIGFHENGKLAVISADVRGQNDLYLISLRKHGIKRLTKDQWDDLFPKFIPGTNAIVFSSNRLTDTLELKTIQIKDAPKYYNLFVYDLDTTENILRRLTNSISNDIKPIGIDHKNLLFLSDQKGVSNIYRYNLKEDISSEVSNFNSSLIDYDYNPQTGGLSYLMLEKGKVRMYYTNKIDPSDNVFVQQTLRNQIKQIEYLRERREKKEKAKSKALQESKVMTPSPIDTINMEEQNSFIDTDNYQFEDEKENEPFSFLSTYSKLEKEKTVEGPIQFESGFMASNVTTTFKIDPLRGTGFVLNTQMNDVLENHKFYGGIFYTNDLKAGDFYAEYKYLKNRIDLMARYDKTTILIEEFDEDRNDITQRYISNTYAIGASLPISVSTRLSISPFLMANSFINLNTDKVIKPNTPNSLAEDKNVSFAGYKAELIFDNTLINGLNLYEGTRAKISYQSYTSVYEAAKSFNELKIDIRHYQKIYRELILATRLYYGRSLGNNPKQYLLGGIDNWAFNYAENEDESGNPLNFNNDTDNIDVLFNEYVNLRGFNYNKLSGSNMLSLNAELRVPIAKILHKGTIKSDFLRNLQFISFFDIGSAWTGKSPFSDENTVNVKTIVKGKFKGIIRTSRNPWIASYGYGIRTVFLGYYMRFDYAIPFEDYRKRQGKYYVSFGYDF